MEIKPLEEILPIDRDEYLIKIQNHCSNLLRRIINNATHYIQFDIDIERLGKDNHVPTLMFRNIIEISDTISILIKESSIEPCKILLRSLLENILLLIYMLEGDEKRNALCYMVVRTNREIKKYNKFIDNNQSSKQFKLLIEKDTLNLNFDRFMNHPDLIKAKDSKSRLLEEPEFKIVQSEYLRTSKKKGCKNPEWYTLYDGPKNIFELAEKLKKTIHYEFFYRKFSESVHGNDIFKGMISAGNGKGQIIQIRNFKDTQKVTSDTVSLLLEIFYLYVLKRIPNKKNDFNNWYYLTIRNDFLDLNSRNYINYKE
ncbi:hypothetical protein KO566_12185 [Flavobacteriaceae bacterium XHP0103]|uniref:DUF5677 domain-containing protein n=1 Tax=Marixanthotalea marina TaxID=2844359 RepID=UPI002989FB37|nr:DUF5677 domain-containing protein [Marixanthotalea marina]MBU3822822.1 hypothetical protein [Marixanthotalea marina]